MASRFDTRYASVAVISAVDQNVRENSSTETNDTTVDLEDWPVISYLHPTQITPPAS